MTNHVALAAKAAAPIAFDPSRRFVRVIRERADGFIEFQFAVGDPALRAELILSRPAFEWFKAQPGVEALPESAWTEAEQQEEAYLFGDALA